MENVENGVGSPEKKNDGKCDIISRMGLNDNKAGMQGLDKEKINKIILENSIGSKFYENERKKDAQVDLRIQKLLEQVSNLTPAQRSSALAHTNRVIEHLEEERDLTRTIVHIDMDAFYASVEERDRPELKNKPMAVGGMDMLSTSNYIARRYGVRAAMPGFIAKKLCPDLILVPTNFAKYTEVSHQVREIMACYDPDFVPMSLDEAYLDITSYLERRQSLPEEDRTFQSLNSNDTSSKPAKVAFGNTPEEVVKEIRFRIEQSTQLTASAGIAPNTLLSKVASDMNKPNGQYYLKPTKDNVMEFIRKLPIRKVGGIGKVTEKMLNAVGVRTCQDLFDQRAILYLVFSEVMSSSFLRICMAISSTRLENDSERKSISTERTFRDISDPSEMLRKCEELCEALEEDARKANIKGLTVTLKIKTASFELHTRSKTLMYPVRSKSETFPVVSDLLKQEIATKKQQLKLRLIGDDENIEVIEEPINIFFVSGVGLSKLTKNNSEPQQKSLNYFLQKAGERKPSGTRECGVNENVVPDSQVTHQLEENCIQSSFLNNINHSEDAEIAIDELSCSKEPNSSAKNGQSSSVLLCPVCSDNFEDLTSLNKHIDRCAVVNSQDANNTGVREETELQIDSNNTINWANDTACFTCPICNATFCSQDISLGRFNTHVDSCLNRKMIREIVRSDSNIEQEHNNNKKRQGAIIGPARKRKKTSKTPSCTLDRFFK